MRNFLSRLRSYCIFDPLVYLYTLVLGTLSLLSSFFDRSGRVQHGFARLWSKMILWTVGTPVEIIGAERLMLDCPAVYVVNHLSALDIPAVYASLPFQFRIMAKKELFRYPMLGWHLKRSGQIPIDRDNARSSMKSLMRASEALKQGMPLLVFPEGGRSEDGQVKPFLGGSFYVAIRAQAPIIPMALVGTFEAIPMNSFHIRPRPLKLYVGDVIESEGYTPREMDRLAGVAQSAVEDLYYPHASVPRPLAPEAGEAAVHSNLTEAPEEAGR